MGKTLLCPMDNKCAGKSYKTMVLDLLPEEDFNEIVAWHKDLSSEALYLWAEEGYSYPLSPSQYQQRIDSGEVNGQGALRYVYGLYLVVGLHKYLMGSAELGLGNHGVGSIGKVIINPMYRQQGLGKIMIGCIKREAFEQYGQNRLVLRVLSNNADAINCYQSLGFIGLGKQGIKEKNKADEDIHIIMSCEIVN